METSSVHKNSAELEREVEAQRDRVASTIDEIQERLSPGQLIDELLSYTKHGGAHFGANLASNVTANPIPAALLGVSLVWLMLGTNKSGAEYQTAPLPVSYDGGDYPYATVRGNAVQRIRHAADDAGEWYSEFMDDAGKKYRAKSNALGHRGGHFVDEGGKMFSGFIDEAGNRVRDVRDEAGNLLGAAAGWASHTWHDLSASAQRKTSDLSGSAARLGGDVQVQADRMTRGALAALQDQPLIAGALAFAAGAALGAALPRTRQEDQLVGAAADEVKRQAGAVAGDLYDKGKEKAGEIYHEVSDKAGEVYEQTKSAIANGGDQPPARY